MTLLRHLKNCWLKIKLLQYIIKIFNHWQSKCIKLWIIYREETLVSLVLRNNYNYNLRSRSDLTVPSINTLFKGQNSISYFGSVIWNLIPAELRGINSFQVFKSEIKEWRPTNCPCRLCRNYIGDLGFVNIAS